MLNPNGSAAKVRANAPIVVLLGGLTVAALAYAMAQVPVEGAEVPETVRFVHWGAYGATAVTFAFTYVRRPLRISAGAWSAVKPLFAALIAVTCLGLARPAFVPGPFDASSALPYTALAALLLLGATQPRQAAKAARVVGQITVFVSLVLAVAAPGLVVSLSEQNSSEAQSNRLSGLLGSPNMMGFLAAILFADLLVRRPRRLWLRSVPVLVAVVYSRSAIAAAIVAMILLVSARASTAKNARLYWVPALGSSLLFAAVTVFYLRKPISQTDIQGADLLNSRQLIWHWAENMWSQSALWGVGTGVFQPQYRASTGIFWTHAHNQLLQDLVTGGVLRAALVIAVCILWLRMGSRLGVDARSPAGVIVAAVILESLGEIPLYLHGMDTRFLCLAIALLLSLDQRHAERGTSVNDYPHGGASVRSGESSPRGHRLVHSRAN